MIIDEDDYLAHYGTLRKSGRYPWGSGQTAQMNNQTFLDTIHSLRKDGLSDTQIAQGLELSTTEMRAKLTIANNERKQSQISQAVKLREKGMSNVAISEQMFGVRTKESTVRALLADDAADKASILNTTAKMLREQVATKGMIDVGTGVEHLIGVSSTRLGAAVAVLRAQGYALHSVPIEQLGTGKNTNTKVLCPPGTTWGEVMKNRDKIEQIQSFSDDGGRTRYGIIPPLSVNPDRIGIKYKEDGGHLEDGVIYVRPGVKDVSIGDNTYAQVRILVGKDRYLKGMAVYKDDLPPGVDLMFNTNKSKSEGKLKVMKEIGDDSENIFGAKISRQLVEKDAQGKDVLTSAMNMVNEEGTWATWSKTLSTQLLSKQSPSLAKTQLDLTYDQRQKEFKRISELTNPTVRKSLLEKFGDETDSAAVQLDAAALSSRQGYHVILPIASMKSNEVYAPNFKDGEEVALVRFPHGGRFEIPVLVVNNKNSEAQSLLRRGDRDARDAIGIHHSVAERLSGADFDGDAVLVIPNSGSKRLKSDPALDQLKDFDPRSTYKGYEGMPKMTDLKKKIEMGGVSNLITDMTLQGASSEKIARAVKHSMVVIDAQKHDLDYKRSAKDFGISALKQEFQGRANAGASTLISRATSEIRIPERKARPAGQGGAINRDTGAREFVPTGRVNYKTGQPKLDKIAKLALTSDAHTLSSGTRIERIYADHSNKLKALANQARKDSVNTPPAKYSPSAKRTYVNEVKSLDSKLALAVRNRPLERQAQIIGNAVFKAKRDAKPNMDQAEIKKVKSQALTEARRRTGAEKHEIKITPDEWKAIQAGAISDSKLSQILAKADIEQVRKLATPRPELLMTPSLTNRAKAMLDRGITRAAVADQLGVSLTTLDTATNA